MTHPVKIDWDVLADLLQDMADRVRAGDSLEGNISWELDYGSEEECDDNRPLVKGAYRIGNLQGQGGMRLIGDPLS